MLVWSEEFRKFQVKGNINVHASFPRQKKVFCGLKFLVLAATFLTVVLVLGWTRGAAGSEAALCLKKPI